MRPLKIATGLLSILVALYFSTASAMQAFSFDWIQETIQHSRRIESSFLKAAGFVDRFIEMNGRLPSDREYDEWASQFRENPHSPKYMKVRPRNDEGRGVPYGYDLRYWRGEWEETFEPRSKATTLVFEESKYYVFGNRIAGSLFLAIASATFGFAGWRLMRRPRVDAQLVVPKDI